MINLSIIIVNYNTRQLLVNCLNSVIKNARDLNYEIIVVDNGSTDGSVKATRDTRYVRRLKIIENKTNLGFAKANNQAIKQAQGKYVLLLNSDTKVIGNALKELVDFADSKLKLGVVGPRLLNSDGSFQPSAAGFLTLPRVFLWLFTGDRFIYASPNTALQADWVMGSAFLIKKEVIDQVGLLDEKFFMYIEEQEWCYRIKQAGWQVWFYPEAEIYHLVRASSPTGKQFAVQHIYSGLIYFYRKHFGSLPLAVLKFLLRIKAVLAWLAGLISGSRELKEAYAKAYKLVG